MIPSSEPNTTGIIPTATTSGRRLRAKHMLPADRRPASTARGVHHQALICSDVERTIDFYQGLLEFPLTKLFQNRDYVGSTHFFFDIGNGNALAFFDFPGLGLGEYAEVLGGHHHLAISMERANWERIKAKLEAAGVPVHLEGDTSIYFAGPRRRAPRTDRRSRSARCTACPSSDRPLFGPPDPKMRGIRAPGARIPAHFGSFGGFSGCQGAMSWTSRSRATLSAIITLLPPSGTLNSMPKSLREIDPVALNPARVD